MVDEGGLEREVPRRVDGVPVVRRRLDGRLVHRQQIELRVVALVQEQLVACTVRRRLLMFVVVILFCRIFGDSRLWFITMPIFTKMGINFREMFA